MNINEKLLLLVKEERRLTHEILLLLNRVETEGLHLEMGYSSLFDYLTKFLGYCESSAYRRIQAARLLRDVPSVADALVNGSLNLTQLSQLQSAAKSESFAVKKELLEKIENKTKTETDKILAEQFPEAPRKKTISYTGDGHINLTLHLSSSRKYKSCKHSALTTPKH